MKHKLSSLGDIHTLAENFETQIGTTPKFAQHGGMRATAANLP